MYRYNKKHIYTHFSLQDPVAVSVKSRKKRGWRGEEVGEGIGEEIFEKKKAEKLNPIQIIFVHPIYKTATAIVLLATTK